MPFHIMAEKKCTNCLVWWGQQRYEQLGTVSGDVS